MVREPERRVSDGDASAGAGAGAGDGGTRSGIGSVSAAITSPSTRCIPSRIPYSQPVPTVVVSSALPVDVRPWLRASLGDGVLVRQPSAGSLPRAELLVQ